MGFFSNIIKRIHNKHKTPTPTREVATQTSIVGNMVQVKFIESQSEFNSYDTINPFFIGRDLEFVSSVLSRYGEHGYLKNRFETPSEVESTVTHGPESLSIHDDFLYDFEYIDKDTESSRDSGLGCCSDSACGSV